MTPWLIAFAACKVLDGDTISCGRERVRLRNVNAVELHEPGGVEAKAALARLVDGREVRCVVVARDRWKRLVGECSTAETTSLDEAMVRGGYGVRR